MTPEQKLRVLWCGCHLLVGGYVKYNAQGSTAMTALSHLMFYDFVGAAVCCIADIGSNFECWRRTSLKRPFGYVGPTAGRTQSRHMADSDLGLRDSRCSRVWQWL